MRAAKLFLLAAGVLSALISSRAAAQGRGGATIPDITGSWERSGGFGRGAAGGQRDPSIPPPATQPTLKPEYQKEYQARVQAAREADAKGAPLATNATLCLPEGMPAMMGATFPMEILQSRGQVTIIEEAYTQVRRIHLDQPQKAIDDVEPGFYGHSVGHWEGDTLVVDTVGVKESVRYQNVPHSDKMRIKERIHFATANVLWDEVTVEDPVALEKPWTFTFAYRRMPDYKLLEYVCEDNREFADENGLQKIRIGPK
jgi:hypothetical protein